MKKGWPCFVLLYNTQRSDENTQEIKKKSDREPTQAGWLEFVFISCVGNLVYADKGNSRYFNSPV